MNLIMSDVEETIMIVDVVDGAPAGQPATVNVGVANMHLFARLLGNRLQKEKWTCCSYEGMALSWCVPRPSFYV
jgi:hypothetical protein